MLLELAAGLKATSMATNALDTTCLYSMESFGGIELRRPSSYMCACMIRAAVKTVPIGDQLVQELRSEVLEFRSLHDEVRDNLTPDG